MDYLWKKVCWFPSSSLGARPCKLQLATSRIREAGASKTAFPTWRLGTSEFKPHPESFPRNPCPPLAPARVSHPAYIALWFPRRCRKALRIPVFHRRHGNHHKTGRGNCQYSTGLPRTIPRLSGNGYFRSWLGLLYSSPHRFFLVALGIVAGLPGNNYWRCDLGVHKVSVASLPAPIDETGRSRASINSRIFRGIPAAIPAPGTDAPAPCSVRRPRFPNSG
jgi:hypothetical protein